MRNNTKLKTLLIRYTVSFDMEGDGRWILWLTDRVTGGGRRFEGSSYGVVLSQAYSQLLRELKKPGHGDL